MCDALSGEREPHAMIRAASRSGAINVAGTGSPTCGAPSGFDRAGMVLALPDADGGNRLTDGPTGLP